MIQLGHRADGRDADLAALEIVGGLHRVVVAHHQREQQRRPGHGGDALDRRALDDEGEARTGAERDVDAVGRHRLLHAGVAAEAADLDLDAVLLEDAGARADVGRHERERLAPGLADAQRLGGDGGRRPSDERASDRTASTLAAASAYAVRTTMSVACGPCSVRCRLSRHAPGSSLRPVALAGRFLAPLLSHVALPRRGLVERQVVAQHHAVVLARRPRARSAPRRTSARTARRIALERIAPAAAAAGAHDHLGSDRHRDGARRPSC